MGKFDFQEFMMANADPGDKGAIFNMAFGLLNHLNMLITVTSWARIQNEYVVWFKSLASIYSVASAYLNEKEYAEMDELFKKVWTQSDNYENLSNDKFGVPGDVEQSFKESLHEFDRQLKLFMKKRSLLIPTKQGIGSALEE